MKSGTYDGDRDWEHEYFQVNLEYLTDFSFSRKTFRNRATLVARDSRGGWREEVEYKGQEYDSGSFELVKDRWDHYHCKVCDFTIDEGYTYWENNSGMIVCDVCHEHIESVVRPRVEQPNKDDPAV